MGKLLIALVGVVAVLAALFATNQATGSTIHVELPTGQAISPAGAVLTVGRGPQDAILTPDKRHLIVTNSGRSTQTISVIDISDPSNPRETQRLDAHPNWVGLAFWHDELYVSGGEANKLYRMVWHPDTGKLNKFKEIKLSFVPEDAGAAGFARDIARDATGVGERVAPATKNTSALPLPTCLFPANMAFSPDTTELYVACQQSGTLAIIDMAKRKQKGLVPVGGFPYGVAVANNRILVSDWSQAHLSVITKTNGRFLPTNEIPVGRHPSAMTVDSDGLLYVAHGNDDSVGIVDTNVVPPRHVRSIQLQPYPGAPKSSIPTDVALSPDEQTLYVTLGGNNAVAVIDLDDPPAQPSDLRYVPTGWFPTTVLADDDTIYITSAKGLGSGPNGAPTDPGVTTQIFGTLQVVTDPTNAAYTDTVRADNRFDEDQVAAIPSGSAMYDHEEKSSPVIDNVILVVRENKTFDQVLGDLGDPNAKDLDGDPIHRPDVQAEPLLTRYGVANTPNTHALTEQFVLADEFRAPIEESFTGHQWLNHGQLSDHAARIWTTEGRNVAIGVDDASAPGEGNLLDRSKEAGISYKTYGWDGLQVSARPDNLKKFAANTNNAYPTGLQYYTRDIDRIQALLTDMKTGQLPRFSYVWIPNDHTYDMQAGARTPQSMVADNDWAVGKITEGLSKSKYWDRTALFFVEDDPQSGRDHIDSHRTVFLAASPWIKRNHLTHDRYDFSSLHRTVELILGLRPTSQVEEKAVQPLTELFRDVTDGPDTTQYEAIEPAVSPNNLNPPLDQLDPVLKPFWELAQTVDRSNVDTDEEKVMEILDGMYHHGAWTYGPGLAPKPTKRVLSIERTHPPVEELIEEGEEGDDETILGVALKGEERSNTAKWLMLPLVALGLLALRLSTRTRRS